MKSIIVSTVVLIGLLAIYLIVFNLGLISDRANDAITITALIALTVSLVSFAKPQGMRERERDFHSKFENRKFK